MALEEACRGGWLFYSFLVLVLYLMSPQLPAPMAGPLLRNRGLFSPNKLFLLRVDLVMVSVTATGKQLTEEKGWVTEVDRGINDNIVKHIVYM